MLDGVYLDGRICCAFSLQNYMLLNGRAVRSRTNSIAFFMLTFIFS